MFDAHFRFAGWFTLDVRILTTMAVFALSIGVLATALWARGPRWDAHVVRFLAVFVLSFAAVWLVTALAGAPTPLHVDTLFPVP